MRGGNALHGGTAKAREDMVPIIGHAPKRIERQRQFARNAGRNFAAEIVPALGDAVALVFRADIESTHERMLIIADHRFPMIAKAKAFDAERIEPAEFAARGF